MKVTSATEQPTRRGGQASLSLFGVGGMTSRHAPHMARPNPAPARPATRKPWTSRIKGALSPAPVVTVAAEPAAPLKAAITTSFPPLPAGIAPCLLHTFGQSQPGTTCMTINSSDPDAHDRIFDQPKEAA